MHPILWQVGGFQIRSYGIMIALGFALAVWWSMRVAPRYGIDAEQILDFVLLTALAGAAGARLVYVMLDWGSLAREPHHVLYFWEGGLSFHGGVIGGGLAVAFIARRKGIPFLRVADVLAPSVALAYAVGRIGCFSRGLLLRRKPTDPALGVFLSTTLFTPHRPHAAEPSHANICLALSNVLVFFLLTRIQKSPHPTGEVFWAYVTLYGLYRFVVEFWRIGATSTVWLLGLSEAQWTSIGMVLVGGWAWWRGRLRSHS
jgi:phosphatidylglycerol:prolipoprotein diacylglycerol transferase